MVDKHAYTSLGSLLITLAILASVGQVSATSAFNDTLQSVYGNASCGVCHVDPLGGGETTAYGTLFESQANFSTNPEAALLAIGAPPEAKPTPTATPTVTATPVVTATPTVKKIKETSVNKQIINIFDDIYSYFMKLSLPKSLNNFYQDSKPETPSSEWVGEMFTMAGAFDGIVANLQEGDMANANMSYNIFSNEYKNISKKVPSWKGYFDNSAVKKLGKDMNAKDPVAIFKDITKVGATCEKCMGERRAQVWAKYYWRDFDTVNISGIVWPDAMTMLAVNFGGIGANAAEGNQTSTNNSFNMFKTSYAQVKAACYNCHDTPRMYYVSDDVFAKIDQMGTNITANNMTNVQAIQKELGIQCYRCHVLHMPAQDMKSKMK